MDTYMNLLAYGDHAEEAVLAAAEEIHRIDDMLSTGNPESEISKLNAAGTGAVSEDTLRLIEESQTLYKETGGLFDIAIYPVMKLWGFPTQEYRVPAEEEIKTALKTADAARITIGGAAVPAQTTVAEGNTASKTAEPAAQGSTAGGQTAAQTAQAPAEASAAASAAAEGTTVAAQAEVQTPKTQITLGIPGMEIDLGGIAKGFTSSRVMEVFKEHGVKHGLVSLGGNVQALGDKENGKPWRVAIQNPESELDYLGVLDIEDKCVITSGGYERFFEKDGVRYHHIIDPRTGYPADSGIISATIISKDGTLADGLSTSLFIMGKDEAEKYWRSNADKFDYILEDKDGKLYVTEGAADLLTTEAETEVVKK
jgi:thiamine biosynthesis lipoprotein